MILKPDLQDPIWELSGLLSSPIVTVLVYWFVFEKGMHASGINLRSGITAPFVLWLIAGLVPWFFFQEVLSGGTNAADGV